MRVGDISGTTQADRHKFRVVVIMIIENQSVPNGGLRHHRPAWRTHFADFSSCLQIVNREMIWSRCEDLRFAVDHSDSRRYEGVGQSSRDGTRSSPGDFSGLGVNGCHERIGGPVTGDNEFAIHQNRGATTAVQRIVLQLIV